MTPCQNTGREQERRGKYVRLSKVTKLPDVGVKMKQSHSRIIYLLTVIHSRHTLAYPISHKDRGMQYHELGQAIRLGRKFKLLL